MTEAARPASLRDRVYADLRRRIVEAEAPPGARLVERDLAAELDVSRVPVREALRLLAAEGLVVTVPARGTIVAPVTPDDVRDLFDVRESLEPLSARLAAERADGEGLDRLRGCLDRWAAARTRAAAINANADFHDTLVALAGNDLLTRMMRPLAAHVRRLFHLTADRDPAGQADEHRELYEAVAAHDPATAAARAAGHVRSGRAASIAAAGAWTDPAVDPLAATRTRRRR